MMDDQLEQYIEYLKEEGYSDCNIVDGYIFIKLKIENKDIVLKCNLDSPFPYKFPSMIPILRMEIAERLHLQG